MNKTEKVDKLRGFLLGRLSEEERDELELAILADDGLLESLCAVEMELIDESIRGELSSDEDESLHAYLGRFSEGRERLRDARTFEAWRAATVGRAPKHTPGPGVFDSTFAWFSRHSRGLIAASVLVLAAGLCLSLAKNVRLVSQIHDMRAQMGRSAYIDTSQRDRTAFPSSDNELLEGDSQSTESVPTSPPVPSRSSEPSVVLSAGALRGELGMTTLSVSPGSPMVELALDLGLDEHPVYRATLYDVDGGEILAASRLAADVSEQRILVRFSVPGDMLASGDYYIQLQGVSASGSRRTLYRYNLRVLAR